MIWHDAAPRASGHSVPSCVDGALEAFDSLQIVIKNIGTSIEHNIKVFLLSAKICSQYFHSTFRNAMMDCPNRSRPYGCTAIFQIVSCYRGNDSVLEIHFCDRFGHASRFSEVKFCRSSGLHGTKAARAGTDITENHYRCCATGPAFAHVRALCALANGM